MKRAACEKLPLLQPWLTWQKLPESVREHAIEVLTALCLEIASLNNLPLEPEDHDQVDH
jgi:hypothetical protein